MRITGQSRVMITQIITGSIIMLIATLSSQMMVVKYRSSDGEVRHPCTTWAGSGPTHPRHRRWSASQSNDGAARSWAILGVEAASVAASTTSTPTPKLDLVILQDGSGFSGLVARDEVQPIQGDEMSIQQYTADATTISGYYTEAYFGVIFTFQAAVIAGEYIVLVPQSASHVTRVHRVTGAITGFNGWPSGTTQSKDKFGSGSYDSKRDVVWLVPRGFSHLVYMSVSTGVMDYCPTWPSGVSTGGLYKFHSSFITLDDHMWLTPGSADRFVEVNLADCQMVGHNGWPTDWAVSGTFKFQGGGAYDGDNTGWFGPASGSHILKINLLTGTMTGHNNWPSGYSVTFVDNKFVGANFFDGHFWVTPSNANMVISVEANTGDMTGYNAWPAGWSETGSSFAGALHDGKYLWCMPFRALLLVRLDPLTGVMVGWDKPLGLNYGSAALDLSTGSIWAATFGSTFVRLSFHTASNEVTHTQEEGIIIQDGFSYGGILPLSEAVPLEGDFIHSTTFDSWPTDYTCSSNCFYGSVAVGDYLWLAPMSASMIVRVHKDTGVMTKFNTWPGGLTLTTTTHFNGVAFDRKRHRLWVIPATASHLLYLDATTGDMAICLSWPSGYTSTGAKCAGSFIERDYLWMPPSYGNMIVRASMEDCEMTGYSNWPSNFSLGTSGKSFNGVVFDGDHHGWFVASGASHLLRVNLWTGNMTTHQWPGGFTGSHIFAGGTFDGQNIWFAPQLSTFVAHIHKETFVAVSYGEWPSGFVGGVAMFHVAAYDGKYVWYPPQTANMLLRVEANNGAMKGFSNWPNTFSETLGVTLDMGRRSMWLPPSGSSSVLVEIKWPTATATASRSATSSATTPPTSSATTSPTSSATVSPTLSDHPTATATLSEAPTDSSFLRIHDGLTASIETYAPTPLGGPDYQLRAYENWGSAGITKTTAAQFFGGLSVGTDLWLIPCSATTSPTKVNKHTGIMTQYPTVDVTGYTAGASPHFGGVYDGTHIWLVPLMANSVLRLDAATGTLLGLPHNRTASEGSFYGASLDNAKRVWMTPRGQSEFVRIDTPSGTMTGFSTYPSGYTWNPSHLVGAAFDGLLHWAAPSTGRSVIGINTETGVMVAHSSASWPTTITFSASQNFGAPICAGRGNLYLIPSFADAVVHLDTHAGVATGYETWPAGFSPAFGFVGLFYAACFDGTYLWMAPRSGHTFLVRFDTTTGAMAGFDKLWPATVTNINFEAFAGMAFDPSALTLWIVPRFASSLLQLSMTTLSATSTQSTTKTHSSTMTAAADRTQPLSLTLGPSVASPAPATTTLATPTGIQHLILTAVQTDHWIGLFVLSTNTTDAGPLYNVSLEVSVEAAVPLQATSNSSAYCTSAGSGTTVACAVPVLPLGTSVSIYVAVSSSLSYQFNGAVTLRYTAEPANNNIHIDNSPLTGELTLPPTSSTNTALTPSPGNSASSITQRSGIVQGDGQCIDVLVVTAVGSLLLTLVVLLLGVGCYEEHGLGGKEGNGKPPGRLEGEVYPNTWLGIPLWRSLALQHAYWVVPCHSQCALNHSLPLLTHVFTLMMLCAGISITFLPTDVSAVTMTAVLAVITTVGIRPMLVNMFYFRFTWAVGGHLSSDTNTTTGSMWNSRTSQSATLGSHSRSTRGRGEVVPQPASVQSATSLVKKIASQGTMDQDHQLRVDASLVALENVELESEGIGTLTETLDMGTLGTNTGTDLGTTGETTTGTGGGKGTNEFEGTTTEEGEEEGTITSNEERTGLGEKCQPEDDVVVHFNAKNEATTSAAEGVAMAAAALTIKTLEEEVKDAELGPEVKEGGGPGKSNSVGVLATKKDSVWASATSVVSPYRRKGHLLVVVVLVVVAAVAMSILLSIQTNEGCATFETSFLIALSLDFTIAQPLVVALTYLYRRVTSDDAIWSELHPCDGEERDM